MAAKKKTSKTIKKAAPRPAAKKVAKRVVKRPVRKRVSAVPAGFTTATPYLIVRGAARALEFYGRAFGAKEKVRMEMGPGVIAHAEMKIGDSMIMLSEENLQWGSTSPETLGGNATHVMLYVKDADAFVARAVAAGATVVMPLENMFWGDRYGKIRDPFGHQWSIGTHIEDPTPREIRKRTEAFMKSMPAPAAG